MSKRRSYNGKSKRREFSRTAMKEKSKNHYCPRGGYRL